MKMEDWLRKSKELKVLVIGDVMLDRYLTGSVTRKSPEADVPVLLHENTIEKLGGAANVALNFKAFGCETFLIGMVGNDDEGKRLQKLVSSESVIPLLQVDPSRPTTVKTRVLKGTEHLMRVDYEDHRDMSAEMTHQMLDSISDLLQRENIDICVLQDYNKGVLTEENIPQILDLLHENGVFIAVDPKFNNYWTYRNVHLFKPNLKEARQALQSHEEESLENLMNNTKSRLNAEYLVTTLSEKGIAVLHEGNIHVQAPEAIEVVDVCGAGDAVLSVISLAVFHRLSQEQIADLGNKAGIQVCLQSGVATVDPHTIV